MYHIVPHDLGETFAIDFIVAINLRLAKRFSGP